MKWFNVLSQTMIVKPELNILLPNFDKSKNSRGGNVFHLSAVGGTGTYEWRSDNQAVATVTRQGIIVSRGIGKTTIYVEDAANPKNFDSIEVEVSEIDQTHFVERLKEIEVSKNYDTLLYSTASDGRRFSNCTNLQYVPEKLDFGSFLLKEKQVNNYGDFISEIKKSLASNSYYSNRVTENGKYSLAGVKYQSELGEYLLREEITQKDIDNIQNLYQNYGI